MKNKVWDKKDRQLIVILIVFSTLPWSRLLFGEYLFDDIEFVASNLSLHSLNSFWDCFKFQLQESKPVANFVMALAHWIGSGTVAGHRAVSIVCHCLVVLLAYANLRVLAARLCLLNRSRTKAVPRIVAFWAALLFAVHPIHSETLVIAQFRGEMLGTLFALACLLTVQVGPPFWKNRNFAFYVSVLMGLSILSKEVFAIILPIALVLPLLNRPKVRLHRIVMLILLLELPWLLVLLLGILRDQSAYFSYAGNVGLGVLGFAEHLRLAARAIIEGVWKLISGLGLTSIRLKMRQGLGSELGIAGSVFIIVSWFTALFVVVSKRGWNRYWGSLLLVSSAMYLFTPNNNLGSEHYWYFPTLALFAFLVLWAHTLQNRWLPVALSLLCVYYVARLEGRASQLSTRLDFAKAEAETHPEAIFGWVSAANEYLERDQGNAALARPYIDRAKQLAADHPVVLSVEFLYFFRTRNLAAAEQAFARLSRYHWPADKLATLYMDLAVLNVMDRNCRKAELAFFHALRLAPSHPTLRLIYSKFLAEKKEKPFLICRGQK
ncbi:MAG: hypothetical protein HY537_12530 [Deltaproteobacteria bacterium]|nr:hypothetical protein [Deltaproteobacteria bacterium]